MFRDWLVGALTSSRKSQADLARETGISHSVINRMCLGKRAIRDFEIVAISKALGISPPGHNFPHDLTPVVRNTETIPVVGVAEAGVWLEKDASPRRPAIAVLELPLSQTYAGSRRAVQAVTPVERHGDNTFYIYVPIEAWPHTLRDDDLVYGELSKGELIQPTLLTYRSGIEGTTFFEPIRSNRKWTGEQVNVIGVVTASYTEFAQSS